MTRSIIGLGAAALLLAGTATAGSPPAIEWQRTFGSTDTSVEAALLTDDGGFLLVGLVKQSISNTDLYLRRTDSAGNVLWHRSYGGPGHDCGIAITQTQAGVYAVVGGRSDSSFLYVLALDTAGDSLWAFRGQEMAHATGIGPTNDGGLAVTGFWSGSHLHMVRIGNSGVAQWTRQMPTGHTKERWAQRSAPVQQTTDGGFITAAEALVKTDSLGNVQWSREYDGVSVMNWVVQTSDGGYIATGVGPDPATPGHTLNAVLLKTSSSGTKQWKRILRGEHPTSGEYVLQTADGGFLVVGYSHGPYIIRTDSQGNVLWTTTLDTVGYMGAAQILPTPDGGWLVVAGYHYLKLGAGNP